MFLYKKLKQSSFLFIGMILLSLCAQGKNEKRDSLLTPQNFSGFTFRNIGPAFMSGRIADIAIHPQNQNIWYVAVGSGGVWKTMNSGTTWKPIFDQQKSYSIGCVTIDPQNNHIVWVGTGENVGGRHVGYGDGIYKSSDDGKTWKNMGLPNSEHISKIIVHPNNSQIVWVAVQGPLWSKGGDRGLYKTTNGGKKWKKVLGDKKWTGVTDILIDPQNPDRLYAATWQRHRNIAAYMGGGPNTAIYRSEDGGENWIQLKNGLPKSNMGKIGLAISPQKPDVIYAAIELDRRSGGIFKSTNRGDSWTKQSNTVSGATGPHYYQELYASPHQFDKIYLMDFITQVSEDGGKNFYRMKEQYKHTDNHAIAFRKNDPDYILMGTDGGLYESFDGSKNWKFIDNLPVTQFYKVAVDDAKPFYNIYGGTQDNNTQGGPSQTDNMHGIRNADWYITLFADGHQPATEPNNPNIIYSEWQEGNLVRIDKQNGEIVHIQPQAKKGESYERYNWDAPILVSPHSPTRLYYASQRVWRSENRGDSWKNISTDLTKNQNRLELPIMGKTQSWDNAWDFDAMSNYNTITSISESPVQEGLLYIGTDDGLIQVTENGGETWTKIELKDIEGIPGSSFVNDIKADLFDANTVYVALDNHKFGDLNPYLMKSTDKGKTWKHLTNHLPKRSLVWRIVQDHINPKLLFVATEFGIYFTLNGGEEWVQFKGGLPTISFRDLAIQRRENDLIGASFGRGFYILDDYSPLRSISKEKLKEEAILFCPDQAWWYIQRAVLSMDEKGSQGAAHYNAKNPPFGAVFSYYLSNSYLTEKEKRQKAEQKKIKNNQAVQFPGWDQIEQENRQNKPIVWLTIRDQNQKVVRRLKGPVTKGFHRIAWDLRYPDIEPIQLNKKIQKDRYSRMRGILALPGTYTASLSKEIDGKITSLSDEIPFEVVQMRKSSIEKYKLEEVSEFWHASKKAYQQLSAITIASQQIKQKLKAFKIALNNSTTEPGILDEELFALKEKVRQIDFNFTGYRSKRAVGEKNNPSPFDRLMSIFMGTSMSTYGPTDTHKESLEIVKKELKMLQSEVNHLQKVDIPAFEKKLLDGGSPWVEGMPIVK